MNEPMIENEQDLVKKIEQPGSTMESKAEDTESNLIAGAEKLERPADGNYLSALRAFSDWVKKILSGK